MQLLIDAFFFLHSRSHSGGGSRGKKSHDKQNGKTVQTLRKMATLIIHSIRNFLFFHFFLFFPAISASLAYWLVNLPRRNAKATKHKKKILAGRRKVTLIYCARIYHMFGNFICESIITTCTQITN